MDITDHAPETKAGIAGSAGAYDEILRIFEDFKTANDERIEAIERRSADVLLEEKVDRINTALDGQAPARSARAEIGAACARRGAGAAPGFAGAQGGL